MRSRDRIALGCLLSLLSAVTLAVGQAGTSSKTSEPTVTFQFTWDQGHPWVDYTIVVSQSGATHFSGIGNAAENGDGDGFQQDFTMSEANRQKIFERAKAANYFQGQFEAKQKNIAKTGSKKLEYRAGSLVNAASYNYSPNADIQELTKLFQAIAITLDYGRKLAYQYKFDKLGMDTRLNELTDMQASGYAEELQAIEPILRKIADDPNLMHIARLQARQLLKSIPGTAATGPSSQP